MTPETEAGGFRDSLPPTAESVNPPCPISHNWPQRDYKVSIFSGITTITKLIPDKGGHGGGIRTAVMNFSRASRKNLLEQLAMRRNMDSGYFGTLTYPGNFLYSPEQCKAHLFALRKRILRKWLTARVLWRMEIKPRLSGISRGVRVPHYHLLIFGLPYGHESEIEPIIQRWWDEIANNDFSYEPFLRSEVKQIRSRRQAVYYASKYQAKVDDGLDDGYGRHWGFFGLWDTNPSLIEVITGAEMIHLKRLIRNWLRSKNRKQVAKLFSNIRGDFGINVFGLGDHDDITGASCTMIDLMICAQRQLQS